MELLGGHVLGLENEVRLGPVARHHEARADAAEFARDRCVDLRLVGRLSPGPLIAGAVDDGIVRGRAAGHVDRVDGVVRGEVLAHLRAARRKAHHARLDELGEDDLEERLEVRVDRVHLEQHHLTLGIQLVEHIERRDGRDVARAEHERHTPLGRLALVERAHGLGERLGRHARLHPYVGRHAGQEDAVVQPVRHHTDHRLAVLALAGAVGERFSDRARLDVAERLGERRDVVGERPRARGPLLPPERRPDGEALRARGGGHPPPCHIGDAWEQALQHLDLVAEQTLRPLGRVRLEVGEGRVHLGGRAVGWGRGGRHGSGGGAALQRASGVRVPTADARYTPGPCSSSAAANRSAEPSANGK